MSSTPICPTCWPDGDVHRLVEHADRQITDAAAFLWPDSEVALGSMIAGRRVLRRQVLVDDAVLCATVRPAGVALSSLVRGDHGALAVVLSGTQNGREEEVTANEADHLAALAAYSRLRAAAPVAMAHGVLFTSWVAGTSLTDQLRARPTALPELLTTLLDDLADLHRDPAQQLWQLAAPTVGPPLPRIVMEAVSRSPDHLHSTRFGETGDLRALVRTQSTRLNRLAAELDTTLLARTGVAVGLTPSHARYPDPASRATLVLPELGPGGDAADIGTLLGHLHLLACDCPPHDRLYLAEGIEAWLADRLAARRDGWRGWLAAMLTIWAATVYDTVLTALSLPAAVPLAPATAHLQTRPLPALAVLDGLTRQLRRHGADAALTATLTELAGTPIHRRDGHPERTTAPR